MDVLYSTEATAWGGREGRAATSDGHLDVQLVVPRELGGPGGDGTNPEQLFATGYAACLHSALRVVGRRRKVDVSESAITVNVALGTTQGGVFHLAVEIAGELPGFSEAEARELLEAADQLCPYSNAIRGNVETVLSVVADGSSRPPER